MQIVQNQYCNSCIPQATAIETVKVYLHDSKTEITLMFDPFDFLHVFQCSPSDDDESKFQCPENVYE